MTTATLIRTTRTFNRFDLSVASRNFIRFSIPSGKAITVTATSETKSWSTRTLEVVKVAGSTTYSFTSAKTIAAGGGTVQISSAELEGVSDLMIVTGGTAEASGTFATITIVVETDIQAGSPAFNDSPEVPPGSFVLGR